jgi:hypothetical protein
MRSRDPTRQIGDVARFVGCQMPACTLGGGQARATNRKRRVSGSEIMTNEPNDNARGTRDRFSPYGPAVFPPRASSPIQSSFDARKPALRRAAWFAFVMRPYVFDPCGIVTVLQPSQYCTEGVRRDQAPAQIARLPANSFPQQYRLGRVERQPLRDRFPCSASYERSLLMVAHQRAGRGARSCRGPRSSAQTVLQSIAAPSG